jgi:hypothetical protein
MNGLLSQMSLWVIALLTCMPRVGEWKMLLECSTGWPHIMLSAMILGYVKSVKSVQGQKA